MDLNVRWLFNNSLSSVTALLSALPFIQKLNGLLKHEKEYICICYYMSIIKIEVAENQINYSRAYEYSCLLKSKRTQNSFSCTMDICPHDSVFLYCFSVIGSFCRYI